MEMTKRERELVAAFRRTPIEIQASTVKLLQGLAMPHLLANKRRSRLSEGGNQQVIPVRVQPNN